MGVRKAAILPVARDDIEEIYIYVSLDDEEAALTLTGKILDRIDLLACMPLTGKIVPDPQLARLEYRMSVVEKYIFYRVFEEDVVIYRVLHGARDYSYLLQ